MVLENLSNLFYFCACVDDSTSSLDKLVNILYKSGTGLIARAGDAILNPVLAYAQFQEEHPFYWFLMASTLIVTVQFYHFLGLNVFVNNFVSQAQLTVFAHFPGNLYAGIHPELADRLVLYKRTINPTIVCLISDNKVVDVTTYECLRSLFPSSLSYCPTTLPEPPCGYFFSCWFTIEQFYAACSDNDGTLAVFSSCANIFSY